MTTIATPNEMTRESLIGELRQELAARDEGHSTCSLAATKGLFCGGFRRFSDEELKQRVGWLVRRRPDAARCEVEALADAWNLARQEVRGSVTTCDVQRDEHDLCNGWDDFSDRDLTGFYRELTGRIVTVGASSA